MKGRSPVVLDIGANEGNFTAEVLRCCPSATVHCFEPNPTTFARLAKRFADERRVKLNNIGIARGAGRVELYDYNGSSGTSHASMLKATFEHIYEANTSSVSVDVISVDEYLNRCGVSVVDLAKVDVEGFEDQVFEGMQGALKQKRVSVIQFEFNVHNAVTGLTFKRLMSELAEFQIYKILPDGLDPLLQEGKYNGRIEVFKYANYVAYRSPK